MGSEQTSQRTTRAARAASMNSATSYGFRHACVVMNARAAVSGVIKALPPPLSFSLDVRDSHNGRSPRSRAPRPRAMDPRRPCAPGRPPAAPATATRDRMSTARDARAEARDGLRFGCRRAPAIHGLPGPLKSSVRPSAVPFMRATAGATAGASAGANAGRRAGREKAGQCDADSAGRGYVYLGVGVHDGLKDGHERLWRCLWSSRPGSHVSISVAQACVHGQGRRPYAKVVQGKDGLGRGQRQVELRHLCQARVQAAGRPKVRDPCWRTRVQPASGQPSSGPPQHPLLCHLCAYQRPSTFPLRTSRPRGSLRSRARERRRRVQ